MNNTTIAVGLGTLIAGAWLWAYSTTSGPVAHGASAAHGTHCFVDTDGSACEVDK